jgi:superfamily II DNA or RNA helicase
MADVTAMDIDNDHGFLASAIQVASKDPTLLNVDRHQEGQPDLPSTVPRAYQQEILEEAYRRNIIAVLPTGVGKTLIGALLIKRTVKEMTRLNQKKVSPIESYPF